MSNIPLIGSNIYQSQNAFRLVGPAVTVDASGGAVQVNANTKFNTNLPLTQYMLITKIVYFLTWTKLPAVTAGSNIGSWNVYAQLTEALARTIPTALDGLFVDQWTLFVKEEAFLTSGISLPIFFPGTIDRPLYNPWATAALQLNMVVALQP